MGKTERICAICYKKFNVKDRGNGRAYKYCSEKCAKEARHKRVNMRKYKLKLLKNMEKYHKNRYEFDKIVEKSRETGISYGYLKNLWNNKVKLEAYISYYRIR